MRKTISILFQTVFFYVIFFIGSILWHPFNLQTTLTSIPPAVRIFVWDGLLLMLLAFALVLLLELLLKRLFRSAPRTTLALLIATLLGLASKLGFITRDF